MHKTSVLVDDRKLARARKLLGTAGIRDTIERALDEVIALESRRQFVAWLRTMDGIDEEVLRDVRRRAWK